MARRMDVELTSDRGDGTWTWRAAGARQPRGVIDAAVVGEGASVGDVLRVEAEIELEGITITAVLPQRSSSPRKGVIEISGTGAPETGSVTTSLLPRHERRGPRPPGERGRPRDDDARRGTRNGDRPVDRRPSEARGDDRRVPGRRPPRPSGPRDAGEAPVTDRPPTSERSGPDTRPRPRPEHAAAGGDRVVPSREGRPQPSPAGDRARRTRPPRLAPGSAHRDALLDSLPAEQRPIAEQLAIGGLPAVRRALAEERAAATAQGLPAASGDAIMALAEQLLAAVREAVWLDRAEAAERILDEISLRDLRAAVAGAVPRDEHGRELLRRLREALEARVTRLREAWERDMTHALEEGRVLQALRLSTRPPEPNTRFPAALVNRLAEAAGAAMTASTASERWLALLEAAAASPVGRLVKPAGVPEDAAVRRAAAQAAGRIPALAPLLGLSMPPPPRPTSAPAGRRSFGVPAMARRPGSHSPVGRPADSRPSGAPSPSPIPPPPNYGAAAPAKAEPLGPEPEPVEAQVEPVEAQVEPVEAQVEPVEAQVEPVEAEVDAVEAEVAAEFEPVAAAVDAEAAAVKSRIAEVESEEQEAADPAPALSAATPEAVGTPDSSPAETSDSAPREDTRPAPRAGMPD